MSSAPKYREVPGNLNEVLSWKQERVVQGDWTVACAGKRYQLDRQHEALSLVRCKVFVRTLRNGPVQLVYRGKTLKWRILPEGTMRKQTPGKQVRKVKSKTAVKSPAVNHPWRLRPPCVPHLQPGETEGPTTTNQGRHSLVS